MLPSSCLTEWLLALLSKDLAQMYGAPEHDPRLRAYLDLDVAESSVRFRQPPPGVPLPELPDNVRSALREVANYAQGSQFGGMNNVLRDYLGLSTSQADHLLSSSASSVEALERALTIAPEDQLQRGMQRLVADVQRAHPSARDLSALQRLHPSSLWNGPPPPSGGAVSASAPRTPRGPRPGTAGPGAGVTEAAVRAATNPNILRPGVRESARQAARYSGYLRRNYSSAGSRLFRGMTRSSRGFGGVVFGNDLRIEAPSVERLHWRASAPGEAWGVLEFWLEDGQRVRMPSVAREDVLAARTLLQGVEGFVEPYEDGQGLGLVGIHDPFDWWVVDEGELDTPGRCWSVVMHPAIEDTDLGWSTLLVDVLPIIDTQLLELVDAHCTEEQAASVRAALAETPSTWKFIDAPLLVRLDGTRLVVERQDAAEPGREAEFAEHALLSIQGFEFGSLDGEDQATPEFDERVVRAMPALIRASHDFERLNDLARVFACLRWAHQSGAEWMGVVEPGPPLLTPASVLVGEAGMQVVEPLSEAQHHASLREQIDAELDELESSASEGTRAQLQPIRSQAREYDRLQQRAEELRAEAREAEEALDRFTQELSGEASAQHADLRAQLEEAEDRWWEAPADSEEEAAIEAEMTELENRLGTLIQAQPGGRAIWNRSVESSEALAEASQAALDLASEVPSPSELVERVLASSESARRTTFARRKAELDRLGWLADWTPEDLRESRGRIEDSVEEGHLRNATAAELRSFHRLNSQIDEKWEEYMEAPYGSQEEATALAAVEDLRAQRREILLRRQAEIRELERTMVILDELRELAGQEWPGMEAWLELLEARQQL